MREFASPYLRCRLNAGAVFEEQFNHLDPVLFASDVQGREAVERPAIGVSLAVQQQLGYSHVAAVSCRRVVR